MSVLYVTAFKDIKRHDWQCKEFAVQNDVYMMHFSNLVAKTDVDLVCFMDENTMQSVKHLVIKPNHIILPYNEHETFFATSYTHERDIMESKEYKNLISHRARHPEHSIPEYNIVNHNKVHFLMQAYIKYPMYERFVWIDFHQARHGDIPLRHMRYEHLPLDKVSMCVSSSFDLMSARTPKEIVTLSCDHIQGSAFVVPKQVVPKLYQEYCYQLGMNYANNIADDDQGVHLAVHQRVQGLYHFVQAPSFGYSIRLLQGALEFNAMEDTEVAFLNHSRANLHHILHIHGKEYTDSEFWSDYVIYLAIQTTNPSTILLNDITPRQMLIALSCVASRSLQCKIYVTKLIDSYLSTQFHECNILLHTSFDTATYYDVVLTRSTLHPNIQFHTIVSDTPVCDEVERSSHYAYSYKTPHVKSTMGYATVTNMGTAIAQGIHKTKQNHTCELCAIMTEEGSDKGNGWHNYTIVYNEMFKDKNHMCVNLFEMGLGSCNPNIPSNMGIDGRPGASLFGWSRYFKHPKTICWGADIDKDITITDHPTIRTFYGDQLDASSLDEMWSSSELKDTVFDIIIDDGLHNPKANINMFRSSMHKLRAGGVYIIEDILEHEVHRFKMFVEELKRSPLFEYSSLIKIPNPKNNIDNTIIVIKLKD